jgi:hypothetical protein
VIMVEPVVVISYNGHLTIKFLRFDKSERDSED